MILNNKEKEKDKEMLVNFIEMAKKDIVNKKIVSVSDFRKKLKKRKENLI